MTQKRVALVTGASSGIGWDLVQTLSREHYDVFISARSISKLEELKSLCEATYKNKITIISADLSKATGAKELCDQFLASESPLDLLVNNAGFGDFGLFHERPLAKSMEMIEVNVSSLTYLTHRLLASIIKNRGCVMNIASTAAFQPGPLMSVYFATKAYVLSFTEGISEELKPFGAKAIAICPGPTYTGFFKTAELGESKLFENIMKVATSKELAEFCLKSLESSNPVAVHGLGNKIGSILPRLVPRSAVRKVVMKMQGKK